MNIIGVHYVCAAEGCPISFGDPEIRAEYTNFVSWACKIFSHHEQVHGRSGKRLYGDVNSLVNSSYKFLTRNGTVCTGELSPIPHGQTDPTLSRSPIRDGRSCA